MLKNLLGVTAILLLSFVLLQPQVQASPIVNQQLIDIDGNILGHFAFDLNDVDADGLVLSWLSFDLTGFSPVEVFTLLAEVDPFNLSNGISLLFFDATDQSVSFVLQGFYELGDGLLQVLDINTGEVLSETPFSLQIASSVPAPAAFLLFALSAMGLLLRRK